MEYYTVVEKDTDHVNPTNIMLNKRGQMQKGEGCVLP